MNITISIPTAFRRHTEGQADLQRAAVNLNEMFQAIEGRFPELIPHLRDSVMSAAF